VPATFIVGQAAHESGWGRREIATADGQPSFNLFGIKAGSAWKGETVETMTTEVIGGVARRVVQRFRAYGSYEEAFADYAKLLSTSPRYAKGVVGESDPARFAQALAAGGYATDPQYAAKLERVIASAQAATRRA
jgi:flagellar protein FlgJ